MRVAYLVGSFPAPSETFLAREMVALRQAGLDLDLIAFRPEKRGERGQGPFLFGVSYRPAWTRLELWAGLAAVLARRPPGLLRIGHCLRAGFTSDPCLALAWLRNVPFAAWLAERCREQRCDLVHAAWANMPAQVAWMAHQLGGPPYTIAGHAADLFGSPQAAPEAWREARGMTVCNRGAWQQVGRIGWLPLDRVAVHPHGLPLEEWPLRDGEPSGRPLVLGVGRLVAKKGFDALLRASALVQRQGVEHTLEILGEGPARDELSALAGRLGVAANLAGQQPSTVVAARLREAAVLALPSRVAPDGDRDGLANVLLEAMATGVPVITTTAGSATDAVRHERTGLLCAPDDPPALAAALQQVLGDEDLRRRLRTAARRRVEQRFDAAANGAALARWLEAMAAP
jgi:hypothetical protein